MDTAPLYILTLHKTYYNKGFFNLGVEIERFVRPNNGPISIRLGNSDREIRGEVNRSANINGTPRIMGGVELRDWFRHNYSLNDKVNVLVLAPNRLWLK